VDDALLPPFTFTFSAKDMGSPLSPSGLVFIDEDPISPAMSKDRIIIFIANALVNRCSAVNVSWNFKSAKSKWIYFVELERLLGKYTYCTKKTSPIMIEIFPKGPSSEFDTEE
jgi:hypothetical protein